MNGQRMVPEMTGEEWTAWIGAPDGSVPCPAGGCGLVSAARWDGVNETLEWPGCGHRAFFPEVPPVWPPPESHRSTAGEGQ